MTTPPNDPFASPQEEPEAAADRSGSQDQYGRTPTWTSALPTYDSGPEFRQSAPPPGYGPPTGGGQAWGPPPVHGAQPTYGAPQHEAAPDGLPQQTETKAVVALVLAVASFVLFPVIPAIAALVLASQASRSIDASGGRLTGGGMVTAAKAVAWVNLVLSVLAVAAFVLFFLGLASAGFSEGENPTF